MPHLVLADDNRTFHQLVRLSFTPGKSDVHCFTDGTSTLEYLRSRPADVLLADVSLPLVDGYELCRTVKGDPVTAHIPVILLVGTFDHFDLRRAEVSGYYSRLVKPFQTSELVNLIEELLATARSKLDKEDQDQGVRVLFSVPFQNSNEAVVFSLSPSQLRPDLTSLERDLSVPSAALRQTPQVQPRDWVISLAEEELELLVGKIMERFPEAIRRLFPE